MAIWEGEAGSPWLGDDGGRAEGLPRSDLPLPSFGTLAGEANAALQGKPGGIATRLASVLVHTGDERLALGVGREVGAPAVGEPRDPPQRGVGRDRMIATADAEPDGDRSLDGHGIEAGMVDPVKLAPKVHHGLSPQGSHHRDLLGTPTPAVLEGLVEGLELDGVPAHADPEAQPAAAQHVDLSRLLRHQRRLALRKDQDAG